MLLIDVTPRSTAWCRLVGAERVEGVALVPEDVFPSIERRLGGLRDAGPVGYLLHHGGELVTKPVAAVTPESLLAVRKCGRFLPEQNDALHKVIELGLAALPDAAHLLLCDTAFFRDLPEHVHTYAVPLSLKEPSLRRYGSDGLCHEWVWETLKRRAPAPSRIVSVLLGEGPNVAAIRDGKAMETTVGFTPVEGISSAHGCGEIDPTIVFQVQSTGLSFEEISRRLTRQSGFSGFLGRETSIAEMAADEGRDPGLAKVRDVLLYQIAKYIGAFVSVLGGVDAVAFVSDDMAAYGSLIGPLAAGLGYLGARVAAEGVEEGGVERFSTPDSPVAVLGLAYDKWGDLGRRASEYREGPTS